MHQKSARIKSCYHKQITFGFVKNHSPEAYKEALRKLGFPNYELFDDIEKAHENVIQKVMVVIGNLALSKNKRIKGTSQDWFDPEIMKIINKRNKVFKNFKTRLLVDKDKNKKSKE